LGGDHGYEEEIIEYMGSKFRVKIVDGSLICPICNNYYFYSPKDLILHIIAHTKSFEDKLRPSPRKY